MLTFYKILQKIIVVKKYGKKAKPILLGQFFEY